jgi:hypothetical protein
MHFKISGVVSEQQSGKPIEGVLVVAYDKDPLFDDLLGTAETDATGRFLITYALTDDVHHIRKSPDLYLAVFAPPCTMLTDTADKIRWGATPHEVYNLKIDEARLKDTLTGGREERGIGKEIIGGFEWEMS